MLSKKNLYHYRAYGLSIASHIPIAGFEVIPADNPDVIITEDMVPEKLENTINSTHYFQSNDHEFILRYDSIGTYYIKNGNSITFQRAENVVESDISAFISGICMGAILQQRKLLPLHASSVIFKNKCIVFAGLSGSGKTTLAAALIKAGGTLVADDISVIDFSDLIPAVRPAFPAVKIWADSLNHLNIPVEGLIRVRGNLEKYYLPVERFSYESASIDHIVILDSINRPDFEFIGIRGAEKFRLLKNHTYLFRGIPKTGLEINHFQLVTKLATDTPVSRIIRPNHSFNTTKLIEVLSAHIN
jgi:Phosphoenolpyruvate carboxykinase